jgi:hypothetical protein
VDEIVEMEVGAGNGTKFKDSQNLSTNAGNFETENNYRDDSGILKFSSLAVTPVGENGKNGRKIRDLTLEICAKTPG